MVNVNGKLGGNRLGRFTSYEGLSSVNYKDLKVKCFLLGLDGKQS